MPGFEVINYKEENYLRKIFKKGNGVFFRHGFESLRKNSYQVKNFEKNLLPEAPSAPTYIELLSCSKSTV